MIRLSVYLAVPKNAYAACTRSLRPFHQSLLSTFNGELFLGPEVGEVTHRCYHARQMFALERWECGIVFDGEEALVVPHKLNSFLEPGSARCPKSRNTAHASRELTRLLRPRSPAFSCTHSVYLHLHPCHVSHS